MNLKDIKSQALRKLENKNTSFHGGGIELARKKGTCI